jgi:hypothetical protein
MFKLGQIKSPGSEFVLKLVDLFFGNLFAINSFVIISEFCEVSNRINYKNSVFKNKN